MLSSWDITMEDAYYDDIMYEAGEPKYIGSNMGTWHNVKGHARDYYSRSGAKQFMKRHGAVVAAGAGVAGVHALNYGVNKAYRYFKNRNQQSEPAPNPYQHSQFGPVYY